MRCHKSTMAFILMLNKNNTHKPYKAPKEIEAPAKRSKRERSLRTNHAVGHWILACPLTKMDRQPKTVNGIAGESQKPMYFLSGNQHYGKGKTVIIMGKGGGATACRTHTSIYQTIFYTWSDPDLNQRPSNSQPKSC